MRVLKPFRASFLHRCFDHRQKHYFVPTVLVAVPFGQPHAVASEPELWKMVASELGRVGVLDMWMLKTRGEVLAAGHCFTGQDPKLESYVRLAMWTAQDQDKPVIDRRLVVFGDRQWELTGATPPAPFSKMPVDYTRAFGGEGFDKNPIGRGARAIVDGETEIHPLPNIEDPRELVTKKGDRPNPASLASWDPTWPVHFKKMGTYGGDYAKKSAPGFADDIDFDMFNVAHPEQRISGFFQGGERIRVENMHPTKPVLELRLPAFVARTFFEPKSAYRRQEDAKRLTEIGMRLDTVQVFPHHEIALMFYRGLAEIQTADATDLENVLCAVEDVESEGHPRRSIAHYEAALDKRLDRDRAAALALYDKDLMPDSILPGASATRTGDRLDDVLALEQLYRANMDKRRYRESMAARQGMIDRGLDPALIPEPEPPSPPAKAPSLDELPDIVERTSKEMDAHREDAARRQAEAEAELRKACAEAGRDYDAMVAEGQKGAGGPPKFTARGELQRLRDIVQLSKNAGVDTSQLEAEIEDPRLFEKLLSAERQLVDAYRISVHGAFPASTARVEHSRAVRDELALYVRGAPYDGRIDCTGVDLSKMDLSNAKLQGAFFESANLRGARLVGADLRDAVLAHADLTGADLSGAKLNNATLGRATLDEATLTRADLTEAILIGASLRKAHCEGVTLAKALVTEADFDGAILDGMTAEQLTFAKLSLVGASFRGCKLRLSTFIDCDVSSTDFSESDIAETAFFMCRGQKSRFTDASLHNLRIVHESDFEDAVFARSRMPQSNLRGTKLARADFSDCDLTQSDLSSADLTEANLFRAVLREALLMDTNLTKANLRGANLMLVIAHRVILRGADVSKANLFSADVSHAIGDDKTSFSGTNVKRAFAAGGFLG